LDQFAVKVFVRLRPSVLDPAGEATKSASIKLGAEGIKSLRIGKMIEVKIEGNGENEVRGKIDLSRQEMLDVMNLIMSGSLQDNEIEEFLIAMNEKGASINEISSAASVMRDKSLKFNIGDGTHIDTCGTGGTGLHIFNCSTASAFVAAACGAKVTKHGNKSISSKTGSADFLLEAGADISHDRSLLESIFRKTGFIFLFAPLHHSSMRYVMPARQKIGKKTIFNLLGPHTNPCSARKQLIGVYKRPLVETFSSVAKELEMEHVIVVHGNDGLDEISITDDSFISELQDGKIKNYQVSPKDFGLSYGNFESIKALSPQESFEKVSLAFAGREGSVQDMIAINSAAALKLSGIVGSLKDGIELSKSAMNEGLAQSKLESYVKMSNNL